GGGQMRFGLLWGAAPPPPQPQPAAPDIKPLSAQKWEVPGAARGRSCVVCCGQRPRDLYSLLQSMGSQPGTATGKTIFLAGGDRPACLAALEVDEQSPGGGGGALSYISSVAVSVSSGVLGLARTARNVAAAPLALRDGLKYLMMTNPLQLAAAAVGATSSALTTHTTGSSHNSPAQPLADFADAAAGQRAPATGLWRRHRDDGRAVLSLSPAPHGSLVAAVDSLGRVMLVEVGGLLVSRMWKGYRDAQVGWLEVPSSRVARFMQRQQQQQQQQHQKHPADCPRDRNDHHHHKDSPPQDGFSQQHEDE
ncbi:hypothetical protein Agub_g9715, partial [Astrephomene gubernaculifera]